MGQIQTRYPGAETYRRDFDLFGFAPSIADDFCFLLQLVLGPWVCGTKTARPVAASKVIQVSEEGGLIVLHKMTLVQSLTIF